MRAMRAAAAVGAAAAALGARAQGAGGDADNSTLACSADEGAQWDWMKNDAGQSPCEVASSLVGACGSDLESLSPPSDGTQNDCVCSMVTYVLVQACVSCRHEESASSWYDWKLACSNTTTEGFAHEVSDEVVVPDWAFYDVTKYNAEGFFSTVDAKSIYASDPSQSTLTASSATSSSSSSPTSISAATNPGPNIGGIVGGVIGGVCAVVVALVALLIWRKRKQRQHVAPSAAYMAECTRRHAPFPCPTPTPRPARHYSYTSVAPPEKDGLERHFRDSSQASVDVFLPPLRPNAAHYHSPRGSVSSLEYADHPGRSYSH